MVKKLLSSTWFWQCFAGLLAICMVTVPFAIYSGLVDKGPSWYGLDVSWVMALNYASIKNYKWGTDIVYTYGPLGWLATRNGWGISRWIFVLFDGFIVVNFYYVFIDFIRATADKFLSIAILICMMLVLNQGFGTDLSWIILFFVIYWMMKTFYDPKPFFIVILILLTLLAFYIKMNTGIIVIVFLCGHLINLFICKKISWIKLLIYSVCFFGLLIISALLLHVSIVNYLTGTLQILKGYNDVMYLDEDHRHIEHNLYILFFALLLWFTYILWRQLKEKKYYTIPYTLACILFVFLLQKQSVLRNDVQHLYEFYSFAPIVLLCSFTQIQGKKPHLKYALLITLFALFFVAENRTIDVSFDKRLKGPLEYIKQFRAYNSIVFLNQQDKRYIPQRVLNAIGNQTVDVFPWDGEYAMENKLNYAPRPVFQSHMAYTTALEKINYDYFVNLAPGFLIYDYDAIDNRYPFNEENLVNLFILKNYTLIDTFTSNERPRMVLKRKVNTTPLQFTHPIKCQFLLTNTINTDHINFIKLDINYTMRGKLKAWLNKPPHVQISYMSENGQWFTYKTSVELLRSGLFVGSLVTNNNEYMSLLTTGHTIGIKKIRLELESRYFEPTGITEVCVVN
jgi:hypothetical protein